MSLVTVTSLTKSFSGRMVLKNTNLKLDPGQGLVIWGDNGTGKTTLLRCLAGHLEFEGGQVSWERAVALSESFPTSQGFFESLTLKENLLAMLSVLGLKKELAHDRVYALEQESFIRHLLKKKFRYASRGEKQITHICKCLLFEEADLFLLDEPLTFLDAEKVKWVIDKLDKLVKQQGKSFLITSQKSLLSFVEDFEKRELREGELK